MGDPLPAAWPLPVMVWPERRCPTAWVNSTAATSANTMMPPTVMPRMTFDAAGGSGGVRSVPASSDRIAAAARAV